MTVIVNGKDVRIELRRFDPRADRWDMQDLMPDLEPGLREDMLLSQEEFEEYVEYWQSEVDAYNRGDCTDSLGTLEEDSAFTTEYWLDITYLRHAE